MKKSPPQAKNFWGPFFQKFDGFWKKFRKINGFNGFLTVFSASTTKKSPPQAKNLGTPFFARQNFSEDLFIFVRGLDRPPPKNKFGDDVWSWLWCQIFELCKINPHAKNVFANSNLEFQSRIHEGFA